MIIAVLFHLEANAQSLVNVVTLSNANLNTGEAQRYSTLQQDTFTKDLKLASVGNPRDFVDAQGVIEFEFPGILGLIRAQAIDITQTASTYSWTGKLLTHAGYFGYYEMSGRRAGWLQIGPRFFEIMPMKTGISTVREIDGDVLDSNDCLSPAGGPGTSELNLCDNDYNTCTATIDILVLLPPDAIAYLHTRFGNDAFATALYVGISTQALNIAFTNSDIPNKKANIILENFNMVYTQNSTDCGVLLTDLVTQATARRDAVGADLVVLLTANADYNCGSGAACAELSEPSPYFCDPSFTFSEMRWIFHPRWSVLHEVGHLMGAGHDRPHDNDPDCAHGFTVGGDRFQRTLMAAWNGTQVPTDTRILHYSNPDVIYNGAATGTANDNNAKVVRNGACVVAGYRQPVIQNFDIAIESDPWVCRPGTVDLQGVAIQPIVGNPGQPPYVYEWRWNFSGNFSSDPSTYIGNTAAVSFPIPSTGSHVWVQFKVTSSDGITLTKLKNIPIYEEGGSRCKWGRDKATSISIPPQKLSLVPNPANTGIQLEWASTNEVEALLQVTDGMGRVLASERLEQVAGQNTFYLATGRWPEGFYHVSLLTEGGLLSQRLLVNH